MSFRNFQHLLLVGGAGSSHRETGGAWRELRGFALRHYPHAVEKYRWATQGLHEFRRRFLISAPYSASTSNLYVATGFNKWGNDLLYGVRYDS